MKSYVLGFLFNETLSSVALIRKEPQREEQQWQRGLLNGIGGGIEDNETAFEAMPREFLEETGLDIEAWYHFATMGDGKNWKVWVFAAKSPLLHEARTTTRELVSIFDTVAVAGGILPCIENVPWLVSLAVDVMTDGRPNIVEISYP